MTTSMMKTVAELPYLYGKPDITALLRCQPNDFIVDEVLNFTPSGAGEHIVLHIEKTAQNTQFVAKQLAALTGLRARDISYAGLKDRHAITRQWFCFKWPIKQALPWQEWQLDGARILQVQRHFRKLRLGALKSNHFTIRLRQVSDIQQLLSRSQSLYQGVPNYYGEQRFGIDGGNLQLAQQLFSGNSISDRKLRGLALSAARSFLFNQQIAARINAGLFTTLIPGDVLQLNGSGSVFPVSQPTDELKQRLVDYDVHLTAALPGVADKQLISSDAELLEQQAVQPYPLLQQGLIDYRLKAERRAIRLLPQGLTLTPDGDDVIVQFSLAAGCFATSVLRELVNYQDKGRKAAITE